MWWSTILGHYYEYGDYYNYLLVFHIQIHSAYLVKYESKLDAKIEHFGFYYFVSHPKTNQPKAGVNS